MPSLTPKQRRAMYAASKGKSTIGIPESVGKEYVEADKQATLEAIVNPRPKRKKMGQLEAMTKV